MNGDSPESFEVEVDVKGRDEFIEFSGDPGKYGEVHKVLDQVVNKFGAERKDVRVGIVLTGDHYASWGFSVKSQDLEDFLQKIRELKDQEWSS